VLNTPYEAAVKTGTSSEFRDYWTLGFTPERVVGVWVGNPDQSPMVNISGVTGAAPIWRDVMSAAVRALPPAEFVPPPNVARASVCAPTGLLPGEACPSSSVEWFIEGTQPSMAESYYVREADGALAVDPPPEARAWAVEAGWRLASAGRSTGVALVAPAPGAVLYPAPELRRDGLMLRASVPPSATSVEFFVDGRHAGTTTAERPFVEWSLDAGEHEVLVVAYLPDGQRVEGVSAFEVRTR
jgi:membrane carboxypeptidase/penicillin-binding protein PbpC